MGRLVAAVQGLGQRRQRLSRSQQQQRRRQRTRVTVGSSAWTLRARRAPEKISLHISFLNECGRGHLSVHVLLSARHHVRRIQ